MVQGYTPNSFESGHVGQTDLQNMENNSECLRSNFSGAAAPPSPVPAQWWADTTNSLMKVRDLADSTWLSLFNIATGIIADAKVATASIVDLAVTTAKLANLCVTTAKLATNAVTSTKIADGAVTSAKLGFSLFAAQVAGDILVHENDEEKTTTSISWAKVKESTLGDSANGTLRIKFAMERRAPLTSVYGRVYKNGSPVGSTRSITGNDDNTQTFSEDISGWSSGDKLQIFAYNSAAPPILLAPIISNLKIYVNNPTWGTIEL